MKNVTEQISIIENSRDIEPETLMKYLPQDNKSTFPVLLKTEEQGGDFSEREILYKVLFDMRKDITDLKQLVFNIIQNGEGNSTEHESSTSLIKKIFNEVPSYYKPEPAIQIHTNELSERADENEEHEILEESLSLAGTEMELIKKALEKHKGKRKYAAKELGISERTLYRKIKEYDFK